MKNKEYYAANRSEMLQFITQTPKKVLELGCGMGDFGALLKSQYGCSVCGIDIHKAALEEATHKLDSVHHGNIELMDLTLLDKDYDLIIANDVLEHLQDPWEIVNKLHDHLVPEGVFIASIPNVRFYRVVKNLLIRGIWEYEDAGILDRTHLRFFTKKTMPSLFKMYQQVNVIPAYVEFVSPRWILKYILKKFNPDIFVMQYAVIARRAKTNS